MDGKERQRKAGYFWDETELVARWNGDEIVPERFKNESFYQNFWDLNENKIEVFKQLEM